MGVLLREGLRTLCVGNQWSYAVFWKVGCHNPKLLIWEECYCESLPCSAPLSKSRIGEAGLTTRAWVQAGDKVGLLIKKMMNHNQFNIVGEGIVGRAAFTGNHEWILGNNYIGHAHPPEVLNELYHQFSAGMQTVAVVPVSPHGVVQLGSSLAMLENMGFVNDVKSLILQLGCVPRALLSDSGLPTDSMERIGVPVSVEMPVPMQLLGMNEVSNSVASMDFGCNQRIVSSNASGTIGQPSHSPVRGAQDNLDYTPSMSNVSMKNSPKIAKSCDGQSALKLTSSVMPNNYISQQVKSVYGAETICLDDDAWIKQLAASNNLKPGFSHQPLIGQPLAGDNILSLCEQKITGDVGCHLNSNSLKAATKGGGSNFYSGEHLLTSGGETSYGQRSQVVPVSVTGSLSNSQNTSDFDQSCAQLARVGLQNVGSPRPEDILCSNLFDQLSANDLLSWSSDLQYHSADLKHHKLELPASRERPNNDLFTAFKSPSNTINEHMSMGEKISGVVNDCLKHASGIQSNVTASSKYESTYTKPSSGDDLYDILGVDYRNKLDKSELNNLPVHGSSASTQNVGGYSSTISNKQRLHSGFCSANEVRSDNIFSVTGTDHLLDAVVSGACSATKQSSGDNMSSRTTLTNISNSSDPSGSSMCGKLSMSDPGERELFDLPKCRENARNITSSSFKSGSSNNDSGSCSRTTLAYGSQVTSWVGHNVRHDSSSLASFPKKNDEIGKSHRKRLKPGENPRPRPKDRQMIQDRVKELREIVPNGAKCSIDALLERTIKHMLFLQSVTKHADKLKQTGESKLISKDGRLLLKDNFEGGKTWAFEVGSQSTLCPIIVEDLNPPRQLLVEMLCEERGFFLEIADLIRGLGLSILKGVMESRNNKIWAQFAVEADRDVTRREVFMSLVRLLEQMKGGISSLGNNALENDLRVHHALHSAKSIPATGRPGTLQ